MSILTTRVLIDAGAMAQEAGFKWPVALTTAVWADCVAWLEDDNRQQVYQDESGRCRTAKSFVGTSKNAVMTQIWIALCMYLVLSYLKFKYGLKKSMQKMLQLLQMNLFENVI